MIWTYVPGPGGSCFGALCDSEDEFNRVIALRDHTLDGQAATLAEHDRETLRVRFDLTEPWRPPQIRITFEDHGSAERIAAFGIHVFEGAVYRATLAEAGVIALDRMFTHNPPEQFHGHSWHAEPTVRVSA